MSCCCSNILELCKIHSCSDLIDTGVLATDPGIYTLIVDFLGVDLIISSEDLDEGDPLRFPAIALNESHVFQGAIKKPDGTPFIITVEDVDYDCIKFETKIAYSV